MARLSVIWPKGFVSPEALSFFRGYSSSQGLNLVNSRRRRGGPVDCVAPGIKINLGWRPRLNQKTQLNQKNSNPRPY